MPETAALSLCRGFCNPLASGTCAAGDHCVGFVGDYNGRKFGICMPDTGFGATCRGDAQCRTGLSCQPWDDPSAATELSTVCEFNVGTRPALAPCANQLLADGGVVSASRTCQSGVCAADPVTPSAATGAYFCLGACVTDADCSVAGRMGVCDGTFDVVSAFDTPGTIKGCRPACESSADCAGYDAGVTCRVRALATGVVTTCSPPAGALVNGAPCTANSQCRSSLCSLEDARGVRRSGVCSDPCRAGDTCAPGPLPQACAPTAVLLSRGPDGLPATNDDVLASPRLCAGAPCAIDADCQPDGGLARCVPDVAPTADAGAVLRCRMPATGSLEGGAACGSDADCASGVCARLATTGARACFQACATGAACPGASTCRAAGVTVTVRGVAVPFDACLP
jgi:hypothetical protein